MEATFQSHLLDTTIYQTKYRSLWLAISDPNTLHSNCLSTFFRSDASILHPLWFQYTNNSAHFVESDPLLTLYYIILFSIQQRNYIYIMNNLNHRLRTSDSHEHQFIPNMLRKSSCCPWCREEIHNNTGRPHFHAEHPSCGEILKENSI